MTDASAGAGNAGGTGNAGAAGDNSGAGGGAAAPWHQGKVEADTVGFWQNKGLDFSDPTKAALGMTKMYRDIEKLVGVRPDELVRFPKDLSDAAGWDQVYSRVGVPKKSEEYDFKDVKFSDGSAIDDNMVATLRNTLHAAKVSKDNAVPLVKALIADMEKRDAADLAEATAIINEEKQALQNNWGQNAPRNMAVARMAIEQLGSKAGLKPEQVKAAVDALTQVGGIGSSYVLEMFRIAGLGMGEPSYIGGAAGGSNLPMSREAAQQELEELKKDKAFQDRYFKGDREAKNRMRNLHKISLGITA